MRTAGSGTSPRGGSSGWATVVEATASQVVATPRIINQAIHRFEFETVFAERRLITAESSRSRRRHIRHLSARSPLRCTDGCFQSRSWPWCSARNLESEPSCPVPRVYTVRHLDQTPAVRRAWSKVAWADLSARVRCSHGQANACPWYPQGHAPAPSGCQPVLAPARPILSAHVEKRTGDGNKTTGPPNSRYDGSGWRCATEGIVPKGGMGWR